jgi:hypothetical protein
MALASVLLISSQNAQAQCQMPLRKENSADATILQLKSEGLSFRKISNHLGLPLGSVTSRYYRLKGIRHRSQVARDANLKRCRLIRRNKLMNEKSRAAIQAAIDLRNGIQFSVAVETARKAGASLGMIGACLGMSKQALHKKVRGGGFCEARLPQSR